jgi:hypothetical protein
MSQLRPRRWVGSQHLKHLLHFALGHLGSRGTTRQGGHQGNTTNQFMHESSIDLSEKWVKSGT